MPDSTRNFSTIGFIGAGRAATALAPAFERAGHRIVGVASRTGSASRLAASLTDCKSGSVQEVADASDCVFIATNDDAIPQVAAQARWRPGQAVVHCSGALTLEPLQSAELWGAAVGSWHPVQTFTAQASPGALEGVTIGIEASGALRHALFELAYRVGASPLDVPASARPLYHAAAVMGCGYVAVLLHEAVSLWESAGLSRDAALRALGKLAETTVANVRSQGPLHALTGPAARGDFDTIRAHLAALETAAPDVLPLYTSLGRSAAGLAGQKWAISPSSPTYPKEV